MRIFLIRHGETRLNTLRKFQGSLDEPLNDTGKMQAKLVAKRLAKEKIDAVYSSAMIRACHTAEEIAKEHGLVVIKRPELNEVNYGEWEGKSYDELEKQYPKEVAERKRDIISRYKFKPPKGESYEELEQRIIPFYKEILERQQGKTIVVVCHGAVKKTLMRLLLGLEVHQVPMILLHNTSLSIIEKREKGMELVLFNSDEHLKDSL